VTLPGAFYAFLRRTQSKTRTGRSQSAKKRKYCVIGVKYGRIEFPGASMGGFALGERLVLLYSFCLCPVADLGGATGVDGSGAMTVSDEYLIYVLDQLELLGPVESRRMFGGAGIYCHGVMFALVADDVLYLKVDESNQGDFEATGMEPFQPFPNKGTVMSYYEVPGDVLERREELTEWARKALRAAGRKGKK
jgi:DNA transformation protein